MSKPLSAKGIGACLKHVLNPRLGPVASWITREFGYGPRTQHRLKRHHALLDLLTRAGWPLTNGNPLPPSHTRLASSRSILDDLYRAQRPGLLRFIARRASIDRAEDIVQQLFARMASRSDEQASAITSPSAYLREGALNLLRDEARTAARNGGCPQTPVEDLHLGDVDPVITLEARDRLARIEQAVRRLKPLTQEIFLARRLDGYSYAEIAQRTGLSIKGVEKQMSRAIQQLGRHLRQHD